MENKHLNKIENFIQGFRNLDKPTQLRVLNYAHILPGELDEFEWELLYLRDNYEDVITQLEEALDNIVNP